MDAKKFIRENKVPLIIGTIILVGAIFYFTGTKFRVGSSKPGTTPDEDKKGGLIFEQGKKYEDRFIKNWESGFPAKTFSFYVRFYKDARFEIYIAYKGKKYVVDSGKYKQDGLFLEFRDGKVVTGTSVTNVISQLKGLDGLNMSVYPQIEK